MSKIEKEDIVYQTVKNLRLHYIDYAMEKYELTKEEIGSFFKDYDAAVKYYAESSAKRKVVNGVASVLGSTVGGAGVMLVSVSGYNPGQFLLAAGIAGTCLLVGAVSASNLLKEDEEYSLTKENKYIKKGTVFDEMAHEYCSLKKRIK